MDYPIWDLSIGGGVLIGVVATFHVLLAHFAVGGGLVLALVETLGLRRGDAAFTSLARRSSTLLVFLSTVPGAISGVGIWFTIGLVQPAGTAFLIRTFVWVWAIEWAFFLLEIVTALLYQAAWDRVAPRTRVVIIQVYAFAAFASLVVIQGILSFMLTPGRWLATRSLADAFFNPTFLPGAILRTGIALLLAAGVLGIVARGEADPGGRARVQRMLGRVAVAGVVLGAVGLRAWEAALPEGPRALFLGAKPLLASLAVTRTLVWAALGAAALLAVLTAALPRLAGRGPAIALLVACLAALGGWERVREGARKPFVVAGHLFSNGVAVADVLRLNREGILPRAFWATHLPGGERAPAGLALFRAQCASCHTRDGYLGIRKLAGAMDTDVARLFLEALRDDGPAWASPPPGKVGYPYMAPFVGSETELTALASWLATQNAPSQAPPEAPRAR